MSLEDRLRETLTRRAQRAKVSDDAWARTAPRIERHRATVPRPLLTLGAVTAALALVVAAVVFVGRDPEPNVVATVPTTTEASTTTSSPGPQCSASDLSPQAPDQPDLPPVVADMRRQIVEAAVSCDYERLGELSRQSPFFSFSFGAPDSEPAEFWREAEEQGERPLWFMVKVFQLPYAFETGPSFAAGEDIYLWPAAFAQTDGDWSALSEAGLYTEEELADMRVGGSGYLGYRVGITAEGDWIYFIAGD